jgi:ATP-binding cassette subfamily B multidrug efflux pump
MLLSLIFALTEAALARFAGQLVDLLTVAEPATVWTDHGSAFLAMAAVVFLLRPVVRILESFVSDQGFYAQMGALIRWRTHRKMLRQSLSFFTDDFAGRIANKQIQLAPALNDSVHQITSEVWYASIFLIGAAAILAESPGRARTWPRRARPWPGASSTVIPTSRRSSCSPMPSARRNTPAMQWRISAGPSPASCGYSLG